MTLNTKRGLSIAGLCLLAAVVVAVSLWHGNRNEPVVLRHVPIPDAAFQRYREAVAARVRPAAIAEGADRTVLHAFVALNRAEVEAAVEDAPGGAALDAGIGESTLAVSATAWEAAVETYLNEQTPELFVDLGRRQGLVFIDRLTALLDFCAAAQLEPISCLSTRADAPAVTEYVETGGLFVQLAERGGFLERAESDGRRRLATGRLPLLQAVFLDHWIRAARGIQPLEGFVTGEEAEWLLRWKAEWQLDGSTEKRVAAARALAAVPGYPAELNAGVLLYNAGHFAEAADAFRKAPESEAQLYRRRISDDGREGAGPGSK